MKTNRVFFPDNNLFSPTFRPPLSTVFLEPAKRNDIVEKQRRFSKNSSIYLSKSLVSQLFQLSFDLKIEFQQIYSSIDRNFQLTYNFHKPFRKVFSFI